VNHIIQTALKEGASDIHIEPGEKNLRVRLRIDGILFESMAPPLKMHAALTSRIKIMANLDIAERRLPQDGRIRATVMGRTIDLRVSTVPTPYGEKTVMRILDDRAIQVSMDELGFAEDTHFLWKKQIEQPHGIILVTGPTGSGKTTTLYSSIRQMDTQKLNVSTVEDPVEYNLGGITQIQTHAQIDMTFARALKALLRQDPDVVMVGEIRDQETATIAVQAALTGHLVLSTLHTNDAPSSVTRLINIGVEPFLVGAALNAVLAQRLVRRICSECMQPQEVPAEMAESLMMHGIQSGMLQHGAGCDACRQTGYAGRLGLYELLVLDDHLRDLIASSPNVTEFRRICCERGMVTLREDGFKKVQDSMTTIEEVMRVTEATI
jgi:type IV pilus assembly protein PilB